MKQVLSGLHWKTLLTYLIIVISLDFNTYVSRLREVFDRLRAAGLKLKLSKCAFFQPEVKYLDYVVGWDGVATDHEKVIVVKNWVVLPDLHKLWACLGDRVLQAVHTQLHRIDKGNLLLLAAMLMMHCNCI